MGIGEPYIGPNVVNYSLLYYSYSYVKKVLAHTTLHLENNRPSLVEFSGPAVCTRRVLMFRARCSISAPRGGGGLTSPCHERGDSVMSCDSGVDISIVSDSQPSERRKRKRTTLGDGSPGADATTHKKRRRKTEAIEIDCDGPHVRLFPDAFESSDGRHKHNKKKRKPSLCV